MKVQNYSQVQYKPSFAMTIEEPERLTTVLYNELRDFTARYGEKYPKNAVIRQIGDNWVIHTDTKNICLGGRQEDIIESLRKIIAEFANQTLKKSEKTSNSELDIFA